RRRGSSSPIGTWRFAMGRKKPRTPTRTPGEIAVLHKKVIASNSDIMRHNDHPYWDLVRRSLHEHGVDPESAIVAEDDPHGTLTGGFVVAADGRVYQYTYDWANQPLGFGLITDWRDVTTTWPGLTTDAQGMPHRDLIKLALDLREEGRSRT